MYSYKPLDPALTLRGNIASNTKVRPQLNVSVEYVRVDRPKVSDGVDSYI